MWYIYLLIGLYLYLPIFSAWVEKASEKAKLWFLVAWGITGLVTLLLSVRIPIHLGRLCVELVQYALLFCRIQRVLAIGTLSAQPRLVME